MTAQDIIDKYISFFEKRGHKRIPNAPLINRNAHLRGGTDTPPTEPHHDSTPLHTL